LNYIGKGERERDKRGKFILFTQFFLWEERKIFPKKGKFISVERGKKKKRVSSHLYKIKLAPIQ
jgi:hypothetical protein